ncbi:hypothetical protein FHG87_021489, partial [Trinorchestia longiramus]
MALLCGIKQVLLLLATATLVSGLQPTFFNSSVKPPKEHHKFLFLLPTVFFSHVMTSAPLLAALASRGHEVHMICDKRNRFQLPNVTCIYFESHLEYSVKTQLADDTYTTVTKIFEAIENTTKTALKIPTFLDLINRTKNFDMILVDYLMLPMVYPFVHGRTYGLISTTTLVPAQSAVFGNVQSPAHFNCGTAEFPKPYSLLDRFKNLGYTFMLLAFKWYTNSITIRL